MLCVAGDGTTLIRKFSIGDVEEIKHQIIIYLEIYKKLWLYNNWKQEYMHNMQGITLKQKKPQF